MSRAAFRLAATLATALACLPAAAMEWTWHDGGTSFTGLQMSPWITAQGDIDMGDPERLVEMLIQHGADSPAILLDGPRLFLNSPGGQIEAGRILAEIIRTARLNTTIDRDSECHSTCTIVFLGGVERRVLGRFGIHAMILAMPSGSATEDVIAGGWATQLLAQQLREQAVRLTGSGRMIDEMLLEANLDTRLLTGPELAEWGVITHAASPDQYLGAEGGRPGGCGDPAWIDEDYSSRVILCGTVETARRFAETRTLAQALAGRPLGAGLADEQARFEAAIDACDGGAALGIPGYPMPKLDAVCITGLVNARHRQLTALSEYYAAIDSSDAQSWLAP